MKESNKINEPNTLEAYKDAFQKLKIENEKLKAQYNHIPISTFTFEEQNSQLIVVQYNNEACKLCEKDKDLRGLTVDEVFIELQSVNKNIKKCFENKNSFEEKIEWSKDSSEEKIYFSTRFVYIPENTVMVHIEDITERRNSKLKLINSEANLRAIFESNLHAFILFNYHADIQIFNKLAEKQLEFLIKKTIKQNDNLFDLISDDKDKYLIESFQKSRNGEKISIEVETLTNENEKVWLELNFSPSIIHEKVKGVFLNIVDISKHKNAEIKSREALEKENEFGKMKNNFISIVSHEFRTPLAGIKSNTQLIQKYSSRWDKEKKSLVYKRIYNAIHYLNQMLEGVSLLGRDYSGQLRYNAQEFDIEQFCLQIIDEIHISIGKAARINFSYISSVSTIQTDKVLLRHIISNLLSNAVKYSPKTKTVDFDVICTDDKYLKIKVSDYGIGISDKDMKHIFEPFQRGENVDNIQGTGLGLSIVKRCVDLLKGEITIQSAPYKGTKIELEFKYE